MPQSKGIAHQAGWYAIAYATTQFVTVLAAILTRRFLGPLQVGVWSLVQIVLSYAEYGTFGVASATPREIPFYVGKGDMAKAARIKQATLDFTMIMSFLLAAGLATYAFLSRSRIREDLFWGLLFAAALLILQQMNNVLIVLLRSFKKFELAGKQMFLSAIVNAFLVAILSYRFHLFGFMFAMCLSFLFNICYILYYEKFSFLFKIDFQQIRDLITYGFPLMLLALLGTFFQTLDRIVISKYLGLEMLGIYSIAAMTNGFLFSFPNSVGVVLLSNFSEKFGKNENRHDLKNYLEETDYVFCVLMPVLIGMAWFLAPLLIQWILPKFTHGIIALKYLVVSSFFLAVSQAYGNFMIVIRRQMWLFPIAVAVIFLVGGLDYWVVRKGGGIEDIAIVQTIAYGINFTLLFLLSHFHLKFSAMVFIQYAKILMKFAWMLLLLIFISKYICPVNLVIRGISQALFLILAYIPFLIRLEKRYHLAKIVIKNWVLPGKQQIKQCPKRHI